MLFITCSWRFLRSYKLEQLEFELEKNIGIQTHAGKTRKRILTLADQIDHQSNFFIIIISFRYSCLFAFLTLFLVSVCSLHFWVWFVSVCHTTYICRNSEMHIRQIGKHFFICWSNYFHILLKLFSYVGQTIFITLNK